MEKEIYIDGILTNYNISDNGDVINRINRNILKVNERGVVQLSIDGKRKSRKVARLVAEAFIPNPNPDIYIYTINIDGNKMNNNINNIEWITGSENSTNAWNTRREKGNIKNVKQEKNENIVEKIEKFIIQNDEKYIYIDDEKTPYVITKEGRIRNLRTGKILQGTILATYPTINLRWDGKQKNKSIHRLVAETWIPNPNNLPIVDHIDGNRLNYNMDNLRWVSAKENSKNIHFNSIKKSEDTTPKFNEEELENEQWVKYKDTNYMVSDLGRVKGLKNQILKGTILDCGYKAYCIYKNKKLGHIIVWEAFNECDKPEEMDINHINGNKMDNRLINLELVSHKENMKKAVETNAWNFRKVAELDNDGNITREFANASDAAKAIGILPGSMRNTIRRGGKCYNGLRYIYLSNTEL